MNPNLKPYPVYKDSGVPLLGEIPAHWDAHRLRDIVHLLVSNVDKHIIEGEIPVRLCNYVDVYRNEVITDQLSFMRATATEDEIRRFRLKIDDVVITKDSEAWDDIAVPALINHEAPDFVCGYHLAILRPKDHTIGGNFLLRCLQSKNVAVQFFVGANGITRYGLSHQAIKNVRVPVAPLPEQAAIARFLDYLDRRIRRYIRAQRKLIALLEEQKQAVIHRTVTRGLDLNVRLKPSGLEWLGEIPEHWEVARSKRTFTPRTELARPNDIQLSATQAYGVIPQDEYERRVGRRIVKILRHLEKRRHVEIDDFVISMRSFQGGLERAWARGCIRSSYIVLRSATPVDVGYFGYLFKSAAYIKALQSTANFIRDGQDLNYRNFCAVDLPFPPLEEQRQIADFLHAALADTAKLGERAEREITLLREYRTRLIADVVTGKLDVRQAAANLPEEAEEPEDLDELEDTDEDELMLDDDKEEEEEE